MRTGLAWVGCLAISLSTPAAVAEEISARKLLVVPFTGEISGELVGAPARLTARFAKEVRATGRNALMAQLSIEEIGAISGCHARSVDCMRDVAITMEVDAVVLGELRAQAITLRLVPRKGAALELTYPLTGGDSDALSDEIAAIARALMRGEGPPRAAAADAAADPCDGDADPDDAESDRVGSASAAGAGGTAGDPSLARTEDDRPLRWEQVPWWAWGTTVGGALLATTGTLFLVRAQGVQDDVDGASTATVADLYDLAKLEDRGQRFTDWGNRMLVVGGISAVAGAGLVLWHAMREPAGGTGEVAVVPWSVRGGGGMTLVWELW